MSHARQSFANKKTGLQTQLIYRDTSLEISSGQTIKDTVNDHMPLGGSSCWGSHPGENTNLALLGDRSPSRHPVFRCIQFFVDILDIKTNISRQGNPSPGWHDSTRSVSLYSRPRLIASSMRNGPGRHRTDQICKPPQIRQHRELSPARSHPTRVAVAIMLRRFCAPSTVADLTGSIRHWRRILSRAHRSSM